MKMPRQKQNIYELNELIVRPAGRPMVWVYLVWGIYDGKAELRAVASDESKAKRVSEFVRHTFKFDKGEIRGRLQVKIDPVEVDHAFGACMTSLSALDLDPQLQESRQKYHKRTDTFKEHEKEVLDRYRYAGLKRGLDLGEPRGDIPVRTWQNVLDEWDKDNETFNQYMERNYPDLVLNPQEDV